MKKYDPRNVNWGTEPDSDNLTVYVVYHEDEGRKVVFDTYAEMADYLIENNLVDED